MTLLDSKALPLQTVMPDFALSDPTGNFYAKDSLMGEKGLLIYFTCNHCPYALAVWPRMIRLSQLAHVLGVNSVAINPNIHPEYPEDAPHKMTEKINKWRIPFPYLVDDTQAVATAYHAQCTPDIYLLNEQSELIYHGRIDDNWRDETAVTHEELREAIENHANGLPINPTQHPSMGCSIKWQEEN